MIQVEQISEDTFSISWDPNDPQESVLNHWTEEDFINCIREKALSVLASSQTESGQNL